MNRPCLIGLLLLYVSLVSSAQILPKVEIIIAKDSFAMLEANPFTSRDVLGTFRGDTGLVPVSQQFDQIELNFRGAYALQGLINDKNNTLKRRNWKVKMLKSNLYMNRRELNFNYQNHVREFMTYYLMRKAQVPLAENRFVLLSVNGVSHGLYMQIVDIDDKSFLESTFKSKKGDLYKSAYDTPADPNNRYWADFSYLGSEDSNYFLHYNKKTNNDGAKETDYSSVRKFTEMLNWTPDESIGDSIKKNFAWENFIRYLVVSNFVSNWDGYPQRPKNSWLYHNPADKKWNFVPWDMDATFNTWNGTLPNNMSINMMGKYCSVFYYMDKYEPYTPGAANETKERPLVWRMMKIPFFRNYYVEEYKKALNTYLSKTMIDGVLDSISAVVKLNTPLTSWNSFATTVSQTKTFVTEKHRTVNAELEKIPSALPLVNTVQSDFRIYPIPASDYFTLTFLSEFAGELQIDLLDITGKWIKTLYHEKTSHADIKMSFTTDQLQTGNYFVRITNARGVQIAKLIIIQ